MVISAWIRKAVCLAPKDLSYWYKYLRVKNKRVWILYCLVICCTTLAAVTLNQRLNGAQFNKALQTPSSISIMPAFEVIDPPSTETQLQGGFFYSVQAYCPDPPCISSQKLSLRRLTTSFCGDTMQGHTTCTPCHARCLIAFTR